MPALRRRPRARELARQLRRDELEQPLPVVEPAQPVQAEVEQPEPVAGGTGVPGGGRRAEHLAAVRGGRDAGRPVHHRGAVLAVLGVRRSGVQTHPYQRFHHRPGVLGQGALRLRAGGQRGARVGEDREQRVTLSEQRASPRTGESTPQEPPVFGEHGTVTGTEQLGQPGRALDVGEQERHQPAWQVHPCRHR